MKTFYIPFEDKEILILRKAVTLYYLRISREQLIDPEQSKHIQEILGKLKKTLNHENP